MIRKGLAARQAVPAQGRLLAAGLVRTFAMQSPGLLSAGSLPLSGREANARRCCLREVPGLCHRP